MGLRFFADHCVSNAMMQTLRETGHEVIRLREQLPIESPDAVVIAKAQRSCNGCKTTSRLMPIESIIAANCWWLKSIEFECDNNGGRT